MTESLEQKIVEEYPEAYGFELEAAYGEGMMSEGGAEAIEAMFHSIDLTGKKALDVGCGLGGVCYHLAQAHGCDVTGVEINPWMVERAAQQIPQALKTKIHFVLKPEGSRLPFEDQSFDIIYSKGVFTHIPDKHELFKELFRLLKPQGKLVIVDWLSPKENQWGPCLSKMIELEGLSIFATTPQTYEKELRQAGFSSIALTDESPRYANYNRQIAQRLSSREIKENFVERFSLQNHQQALEGYEWIAKAIETRELLVIHVVATKEKLKL